MDVTVNGQIVDHTEINVFDAVVMFAQRAQQLDEVGFEAAEDAGRYGWLRSEFAELVDARREGNELEIDDALVDITWQALGYLVKRRGPVVAKAIMDAVSWNNIQKVEPVEDIVFYPGTTKVGKKPGHQPPDLAAAIAEAESKVATEQKAVQ